MTTSSIIAPLENYYTVTTQDQNPTSYCTLQWRRGQLLVKPPGQVLQPYLPSLHKEQSLVKCLEHSPVTLVRIDPKLGEYWLKVWATACEQASKPIFLRIPSAEHLSKQGNLWSSLQRLFDWIIALVFLLALSPVILVLVLLMRVYSPGTFFECEWRVGKRGKLFRAMKFRTTAVSKKNLEDKAITSANNFSLREDDQNVTPLGHWMRKYNLDNLPQLFNVVQGEMSLVGPRCWTLEEAVRLSSEKQLELNKLPGITGSWEVERNSNKLHLDSQTL
ncbi:MAG: sugar transferase [Tolypothrix sp. Co-bin9]|nr:sugar transferase [Tolypothrix sp. Co-bin9]